MTEEEHIPRYRILLQDGETSIQIAAGTEDLTKFSKTDLMRLVNTFKKQIKASEWTTPVDKEIAKRGQE